MVSSKVKRRWGLLLLATIVCLGATGVRYKLAQDTEQIARKAADQQQRLDRLIKELGPEDGGGSGVGDFPPWYGGAVRDGSASRP
jgi:hypothetical protein